MEKFNSAAALIAVRRPERPVRALRPHVAARAARWFLENFPGDIAYAYKANSSVCLIGALYGAGIRHFDVASLPEIEDAATIPHAKLHFMHPVKSREAIRQAYWNFGVRSFSLDSEEELAKILAETGNARDLSLFVRIATKAKNSRIPLERKFGVVGPKSVPLIRAVRQAAAELGVTFHVGSQTATPDAYVDALEQVQRLIVKAGVVVDRIDVGGGFPSRYPDIAPAPLAAFTEAIRSKTGKMSIGEHCRLMCEPGRALVAEAESLIVRVDARRGNELFINDGTYGMLFDAGHLGFTYPVRLVGDETEGREPLEPFQLWGPTCDSIDHMKGPFMLPGKVNEGDFLEIGTIGAYGRALASNFNGYGRYEEVILADEPMQTMYPVETAAPDNVVRFGG